MWNLCLKYNADLFWGKFPHADQLQHNVTDNLGLDF